MTIPTNLKWACETEFGAGFIICLVKFAEHAERWISDKRIRLSMANKHPFDESDAVRMFFNGASDHLYEIEVPRQWQNHAIGKKTKELQSFALEIGHEFSDNTWVEADVTKAYDLCREIALLVDVELGLKPDLGQW